MSSPSDQHTGLPADLHKTNETVIMDLPYEVLVYLFKYLPKSDRKAASETCRQWFLAANDYIFLKNKFVVFKKAVLNDETSPLHIIQNSEIAYCNFSFNEMEITGRQNEFWDTVGENVKSLTFRRCKINKEVFEHVLQKCRNIEKLSIICCKKLVLYLREGQSESEFLTFGLCNLIELSLSRNYFLTDALFYRFTMTATFLQELDLTYCDNLSFYPTHKLRNLLFPNWIDKYIDKPTSVDIFENPFTFYCVLQCITSRAQTIKRLRFSNTLIDDTSLELLSEVHHLKLQSLQVKSCKNLTNPGFLTLTKNQTSLIELDIGYSAVTDKTVVHISKFLVNLEILNIQGCRAVTDLGVKQLGNLKKLRVLNVSECYMCTEEGLEKGICAEINEVLEDLDIHSLYLNQEGLILLSERLPRLKFLDISDCDNAVTDASLQVILKNQVLLHTLRMSYCDKVSDAGLTGLGKVGTEVDDEGPTMTSIDEPDSDPCIHRRSGAEEEIVQDARRKLDVPLLSQLLCENLSTDTFTGFSLTRMKGLRELDISYCDKITDVSLINAFNFKELVALNLYGCQQLTNKGMKHLVRNCPSIEYLNLHNLNNETVNEIVQGLRRLQIVVAKPLPEEFYLLHGSNNSNITMDRLRFEKL